MSVLRRLAMRAASSGVGAHSGTSRPGPGIAFGPELTEAEAYFRNLRKNEDDH